MVEHPLMGLQEEQTTTLIEKVLGTLFMWLNHFFEFMFEVANLDPALHDTTKATFFGIMIAVSLVVAIIMVVKAGKAILSVINTLIQLIPVSTPNQNKQTFGRKVIRPLAIKTSLMDKKTL